MLGFRFVILVLTAVWVTMMLTLGLPMLAGWSDIALVINEVQQGVCE